jgi:hypothetical protein
MEAAGSTKGLGTVKAVRNNAFAHINNSHLLWRRGVAVWRRRSVVT